MLFYKQDFYNYHSFYTQTFLYGLIPPPPPPPLSHNFFDTPSMIFKKITTPINKAGGVPLSILHMISYGSPNGEIDEGYI